MDTASTDTLVQNDIIEPVTDSENPVDNAEAVAEAQTEPKSDVNTTPKVEHRDGKLFVDGIRVYTRDDTNKIAANARHETESKFLSELNVDSIDQVKKLSLIHI